MNEDVRGPTTAPPKPRSSSAAVQPNDVACRPYQEFFATGIANSHTRHVYNWAVRRFLSWCEAFRIDPQAVDAETVSDYFAQLLGATSNCGVHLSAVRKFYDWMIEKNFVLSNPATSFSRAKRKTKMAIVPSEVLTAAEIQHLLRSIEVSTAAGLRDAALIAVMVHCFLRVEAVLDLGLCDYERRGTAACLIVRERGKSRPLQLDNQTIAYLEAYIRSVLIRNRSSGKLIRSVTDSGTVRNTPMRAASVAKIVKHRINACGLPEAIGCNGLRKAGMRLYLENGGTIEAMLALGGLKGTVRHYRYLTASSGRPPQ
jgi:site-specific recombinase XerD